MAGDLDMIAEQEHLTRIDVARQILLDGIAQRRRRLALQLYREGKVITSKAAEIAGLSLWEWMDTLDQAEIASGFSVADSIDEVRRIVASAGSA